MTLARYALVLCPLLAAAYPALADTPPKVAPMPGSFLPADVTSADIQQAREAVQAHLATLRIEEVLDAWTQVVAGINYKLLCRVSGGNGPVTWEFVIWHRLDDTWELWSAKRM